MKLKYCVKCKTYTLADKCRKCGATTTNPYPSRFSPEDTYGEYRRRLKRELMKI